MLKKTLFASINAILVVLVDLFGCPCTRKCDVAYTVNDMTCCYLAHIHWPKF